MTYGQRFQDINLRVQPACNRLGSVHCGVVDVERMEGERKGLKVLPVRALHLDPSRDFSAAYLHLQDVLAGVLASREPLLGLRPCLVGVAQPSANRERITLDGYPRKAGHRMTSVT